MVKLTVATVLDGGEQEVHIWTNPSLESISIFAKVFGSRIFDHVGIREPGSENRIAGALRLVHVSWAS